MRIFAIDWSGDAGGAKRKIWLAEVLDGRLVRLESGRDRDGIAAHLIEEAERDPAVMVGIDFAFSLPAWFLDERRLDDGPALWALAEREAEGWLAACEPPFWGRPGRPRPDLPGHFRLTDRAAPPTAGISPKSPFQVGGAGAVGTGSLRGMRLLHRLHEAGFAVWPFAPSDTPNRPLVVEIYPRLLTGKVVKSSAEARFAYLADRYDDMPPILRDRAATSEDAFDAAITALVMAEHLDELAALTPVTDVRLVREGIIWSPGWSAWHGGERTAATIDGTEPTRKRAIPPTVEQGRAAPTLEIVERFNAAFNRHDVEAVMALMTEDCVFENTSPAPDGERYAGQAAVRAFWERFFASSPQAVFEAEDLFAAGDRCFVRWRYRWGGGEPEGGHIRGVDVFRVRDGKVAEKLSYVKG